MFCMVDSRLCLQESFVLVVFIYRWASYHPFGYIRQVDITDNVCVPLVRFIGNVISEMGQCLVQDI